MASPNAGVAAGRLDDGPARTQQALTLGGEDHLQRGTVLGRSARVGGLGLQREDTVDALVLADPLHANERGVADQVDDRIRDLRAGETRVSVLRSARSVTGSTVPPIGILRYLSAGGEQMRRPLGEQRQHVGRRRVDEAHPVDPPPSGPSRSRWRSDARRPHRPGRPRCCVPPARCRACRGRAASRHRIRTPAASRGRAGRGRCWGLRSCGVKRPSRPDIPQSDPSEE